MRVVHFEIHADDPQRAMDFYTKIFGWKFTKWEGSPTDYWMLETGPKDQPGINGGLLKRQGALTPNECVSAFVCTIDVPALDEFIGKVTMNGGTIGITTFLV